MDNNSINSFDFFFFSIVTRSRFPLAIVQDEICYLSLGTIRDQIGGFESIRCFFKLLHGKNLERGQPEGTYPHCLRHMPYKDEHGLVSRNYIISI